MNYKYYVNNNDIDHSTFDKILEASVMNFTALKMLRLDNIVYYSDALELYDDNLNYARDLVYSFKELNILRLLFRIEKI